MGFFGLQAQKIELVYTADSSFFELDSSIYEFPKVGENELYLRTDLQKVIQQLRKDSYLAANVDEFVLLNDSVARAKIYVGQPLVYGKLNWKGIEKEYFQDARIRSVSMTKKVVSKEEVLYVMDVIREQLDKKGYPLAQIFLKNQYVRNDSLYADIQVDKGPLIRISELVVKPDSIISSAFIRRYVGIQENDVFDFQKIKEIPSQLNTLPYLQMGNSPQIKIYEDKAVLELELKKRNASRFDFLIGVLPNVENDDRLTISGEITADLKNKLKQGEEIYFYFRQLKPETQRIDFNFKYPYLLNLPFGIQSSFSLYRNGRESRDLNAELGIDYRSSPFSNNTFYGSFQSSRLISIDSAQIVASGKLPASLDVSLNNIGYRYEYDKRDYRFNPRKGFKVNAGIKLGIKSILKNNRITELRSESVNFEQAYDTLNLRVFQASTEADIEYYLALGKSSTLLLANALGVKYNPTQVFSNEYYRIGGSNILRGFDEESIRAQYFTIMTAEYRYLLGLNSYFSAFVDYGFLYNGFRPKRRWDQPLGFGAGLSFQTNVGVFKFEVALGREQGNPIDFRNTKTHFGYISLF